MKTTRLVVQEEERYLYGEMMHNCITKREPILSDIQAYLSEHNLVAVPKHGLSRVFRTGYWTGQMQSIAERVDQDLK